VKYLCLIYDDEQLWARMSAAEQNALMGEYFAFSRDVAASGHMRGGNQLQPTSAATTLRVRDGALSVTDGPYAETKEALGGYFLIEARDLNEALQVAARIPSARIGAVEVRPIVEMGADAPADALSAAAGVGAPAAAG
jgi:hypothetical protein